MHKRAYRTSDRPVYQMVRCDRRVRCPQHTRWVLPSSVVAHVFTRSRVCDRMYLDTLNASHYVLVPCGLRLGGRREGVVWFTRWFANVRMSFNTVVESIGCYTARGGLAYTSVGVATVLVWSATSVVRVAGWSLRKEGSPVRPRVH